MAGGIPKMLKRMLPVLKREALTCTGRTVEGNVSNYSFPFPDNDEVMKTLDEPFSPRGGIAVLKGNLAPDTGVTKPGAIDPALHVFTGSAKVFDSEDEANEAILAGEIKAGDVVVIRYEGPKGGPGMREMYRAMKYLYGMGLNKSTGSGHRRQVLRHQQRPLRKPSPRRPQRSPRHSEDGDKLPST